MKTRVSIRKRRSGFTLIELLIVIGLLGALTALVLPAMMADREDALGNICDYNQAGTLRVLKQFQQFTGKLPNGMHSGLTVTTASSISDVMPGIPGAQKPNLEQSGSYYALTAPDVTALNNIGITQLAYDSGLHYQTLTTGTRVLRCLQSWVDDGGAPYSFEGRTIADYEADGGKVLVAFVAPTTDWESGVGGNDDWGQGNVKISLDLEGKCPIPATGVNGDPEFAYYMAYIAVYTGAKVESQTPNATSGTLPAVTIDPAYGDSLATVQGEADTDVLAAGYTAGADWALSAGSLDVYERTYSYNDGVNMGTLTVKVKDLSATGEARLVGTSCPECGVLNP